MEIDSIGHISLRSRSSTAIKDRFAISPNRGMVRSVSKRAIKVFSEFRKLRLILERISTLGPLYIVNILMKSHLLKLIKWPPAKHVVYTGQKHKTARKNFKGLAIEKLGMFKILGADQFC